MQKIKLMITITKLSACVTTSQSRFNRLSVVCRDAFIGRKLKQIPFVLVLTMKKQIGLIRFSLDHEIINRFDLF